MKKETLFIAACIASSLALVAFTRNSAGFLKYEQTLSRQTTSTTRTINNGSLFTAVKSGRIDKRHKIPHPKNIKRNFPEDRNQCRSVKKHRKHRDNTNTITLSDSGNSHSADL